MSSSGVAFGSKSTAPIHPRTRRGIPSHSMDYFCVVGHCKIGLPQGTTLTTKKALECMAIIKKHSKDFGGSLEDPDVIKLCNCSRNSYYKYKKEAKSN